MSLNHLPAAAHTIASEQGWSADTVLIHLLGLIQEAFPDADERLAQQFRALADEENRAAALALTEEDAAGAPTYDDPDFGDYGSAGHHG